MARYTVYGRDEAGRERVITLANTAWEASDRADAARKGAWVQVWWVANEPAPSCWAPMWP